MRVDYTPNRFARQFQDAGPKRSLAKESYVRALSNAEFAFGCPTTIAAPPLSAAKVSGHYHLD